MNTFEIILTEMAATGTAVIIGAEAVVRHRRWRERVNAKDAYETQEWSKWLDSVRDDWYSDRPLASDLLTTTEDCQAYAESLLGALPQPVRWSFRRPQPGRPDDVADFEARHKIIADRCARLEATLSSP